MLGLNIHSSDTREKFFYTLCEYLLKSSQGRIYDDALQVLAPSGYPAAIARAYLRDLERHDLVERDNDRDNERPIVGKSPLVPDLIRRDPLAINRVWWQLTAEGAARAHAVMQGTAQRNNSDKPATEDQWAPLPLERSEADVANAVSAVEDLHEAIRSDNGLASSEPQQRKFLLSSFSAGLSLLKSHAFSKAQIQALLLSPAKWVAEKFAASSIGEIAKFTVEALKKLIF